MAGRCVGADLSRFVHDCVENFHCIFYRANLGAFQKTIRKLSAGKLPRALAQFAKVFLHRIGRARLSSWRTRSNPHGQRSSRFVFPRPRARGRRHSSGVAARQEGIEGPQTKGLANGEQTGRAVSIRRQRSSSKLKMRSFSHNSEECGGSRSRTILQHRLSPAMIG